MLFCKSYKKIFCYIEKLFFIFQLLARLVVANVFFNSGLVKISNWENTLKLFEYEYKVPFLPYELSALSGTFFELTCPVLLVMGLATRIAALPLIAMTLVIQFTYIHNYEHFYWFILLGIIACKGSGCLSIDYLITRFCFNKKCTTNN
jgi:putative oxidoreductase